MSITNRIRKSQKASPTELRATGESAGIEAGQNGGLFLGTVSASGVQTVQQILTTEPFVGTVGPVKVKKLLISATPTGAEQDTTFDLPAKAVIHNVYVDVTTAEAVGGTKTLDVGLLSSESGGDADGFVDGISVASTGVKVASLVSGAVTLGVLLKETVTDSAAATQSARKPFATTGVTARSITFTAGSNDFTAFRGAIYIEYSEIG